MAAWKKLNSLAWLKSLSHEVIGSPALRLSWNAVSNVAYLIESSTNLIDWADYEQLVATNNDNSVDLPANRPGQMFFPNQTIAINKPTA